MTMSDEYLAQLVNDIDAANADTDPNRPKIKWGGVNSQKLNKARSKVCREHAPTMARELIELTVQLDKINRYDTRLRTILISIAEQVQLYRQALNGGEGNPVILGEQLDSLVRLSQHFLFGTPLDLPSPEEMKAMAQKQVGEVAQIV